MLCPHCGKICDSGRPLGALTDTILLLDAELARPALTQDQRILLLSKRADTQLLKQKLARKAYERSRNKATGKRKYVRKAKQNIRADEVQPQTPKQQEADNLAKFLQSGNVSADAAKEQT